MGVMLKFLIQTYILKNSRVSVTLQLLKRFEAHIISNIHNMQQSCSVFGTPLLFVDIVVTFCFTHTHTNLFLLRTHPALVLFLLKRKKKF